MQFFLLINNESTGPFTIDEILEMLKSGQCQPETMAWKEGMENWQTLRDLNEFSTSSQPPHLPDEPNAQEERAADPVEPRMKAKAVDFFRGYRGLFQRIKNSPRPQPAQWYDNYAVVFSTAFLAFYCFGLGLIPLMLTNRLSGIDKGRLCLLTAWPLFFSVLPLIWALFVFLICLIPLMFLGLMWTKKWFSPVVRYSATALVGLGVILLVGMSGIWDLGGASKSQSSRNKNSYISDTEASRLSDQIHQYLSRQWSEETRRANETIRGTDTQAYTVEGANRRLSERGEKGFQMYSPPHQSQNESGNTSLITPAERKCYLCGGSGTTSGACFHCKGTGLQGQSACGFCDGRKFTPCNNCGGKGKTSSY
jgi:hypothetical protein